MIDSPYLVTPGKKFRMKDVDPDDTGQFKDKHDARPATEKNLKDLWKMQEVFYADARHAMLVVFQAMDTGGKDGAIEHIFSGVNPQGCSVHSFKAPSHEELTHDYLWRTHDHCPGRGMIGIFNRSHYESVLVERVKELVPEDVWKRRYEHINHFEKMLADEGTIILKFYLHISKEEQKNRLQARLDDPAKNWKFNPSDLTERKRWDEYMDAFEDALGKCSNHHAPWYCVPSNRKWYRNWVISDTIVRAMKLVKPRYPTVVFDPKKIVVE